MREPKNIIVKGKTLEEILINHKHWANEDCAGWENMRADLRGADLRGADLRGADLRGADLRNADLRNAYLSDANFTASNLRGAWLDTSEEARKGQKMAESIIGWKKCMHGVLVKLEIPRGAIVFSINNNKCRTDKAKVLEIVGSDRAFSIYNGSSYYVGDVIEVFDFNCEYNGECDKGIHFFKTREEAESYKH